MLTKPYKRSIGWGAFAMVGLCFLQSCGSPEKPAETDPKTEKLKLQPGFIAEHLYSPSDHEEGSWVSMAFDDKGRLITSDQYGGLFRTTIPEIGSKDSVKVEKLSISWDKDSLVMGYAQGLLYAFNSLYVMINNNPNKNFEKGSGLYRLEDTDGDEQFDKITLLKRLQGAGEHGPHSIVLSPDKQSLYVVAGNFTDLPEMSLYSLPNNWTDDNLIPKIVDPRGHATDRNAPGGWIANLNPDGSDWKLISAGYRNSFDIDFNEAGDLFVYDSDMEWDFGLPWYRPTRILHATKGSEYGWRTGSVPWSPAYPDNLPALLNIGQGSPTNFVYVSKARFPEKYKNTFFAFDWSFGIIHAIHTTPEGASYKVEREEFLSGVPLPLTDGVIGPDGALYFLTGGRRLSSDMYRVYHKDYKKIAEDANVVKDPVITPENKLRRELEAFHGVKNTEAVNTAWPHLAHSDRYVRYAARIAVESQPVSEWRARALGASAPVEKIHAGLALARQGEKSDLKGIISNLIQIDYTALTESQKLDLVRTIEVALYRFGQPDAQTRTALLDYLNPKYPAGSASLNRIFVKILVFLQSPEVVEKTLALMDIEKEPGIDVLDSETATNSSDLIYRNPQYGLDIAGLLEKMPPAQHFYYAVVLSGQKAGWTKEQREKYFKWFHGALSYKGGRSYIGFVDRSRKLALAHVPKADLAYYEKLSGSELMTSSGNDLVGQYNIQGPGRRWNLDEADSVVQSGLKGRNFDTGKLIYSAVLCNRCHAIAGEGEGVGPDLTQLATRFSSRDILEAIIDPNKAVSDQYASTVFSLKDGGSIVGRLANEDATHYYVAQNPFTPDEHQKIAKKDVVSTAYSTVSVMLPGLINGLNPEELKDLMAFLMAGGNKENPIYKE